MIAEVAVDEPLGVLLVELDEVAVTQLERPLADVPLRGRVVWADEGLDELSGEYVLLSLAEGSWWQRPGPPVRVVPELRVAPAVAAHLRSLR